MADHSGNYRQNKKKQYDPGPALRILALSLCFLLVLKLRIKESATSSVDF